MLVTKGLQVLAKLGKESAVKNAEAKSRVFCYQPKTPARLQELKK